MSGGHAGQERDYALSEVIGFILLLGVLITAMALWMMYVVPANGREDEITHMNQVKDQFTGYKISLDSLWINSPYGASYSQEGTTLSTSMNLGTGGGNTEVSGLFLPMMNPIASSAVLSIQDTGDILNISYNGPSGSGFNTYKMSMLKYQSMNNYWIQQAYYYQDGGVFLTQVNGSVCRVAPPVSFVNNSGMSCSVAITPIILNGAGSMGGSGPVRVDTRLKARPDPVIGQVYWVNTSVTVANYTAAQMWLDVFNNTRRNGGINNTLYYKAGVSSQTAIPGEAFMLIQCSDNGEVNPDVYLAIRPAEYDVTINNIVSNLN
jgi:hypothetical protein